jgi:uncharacterized protein
MAVLSERLEIPLFPLSAVLYPGGRMRLRIFERRYLDMVRECARGDRGFGICQILEGHEAGLPAVPALIGTHARIIDFHTGDDGLLGLAIEGDRRFRVTRTRANDNGLLHGEVGWLPDEPVQTVPVEFALLQTILERLIESMPGDSGAARWQGVPRSHYDDAGWVGFRLAELLPLNPGEHQRMLEIDEPLRRLAELQDILPRFQKG